MKPTLISISGPTAVGKTSLAIAAAVKFNAEIISFDSRQFYAEMKIGTAVPEPHELQAAKHHFIQHISVKDTYTVGDFEHDAIQKIKDLITRNKNVLLVGGSGLYEKAVLEGLDSFPDVPKTVKQEVAKDLEQMGLDFLVNELAQSDPKYYEIVDRKNPRRIQRALEICRATQRPFTDFWQSKKSQRDFESIKIGLTREREELYTRINRRVDLMLENGLEQEAKSLHTLSNLRALQTVGYQEFFKYFNGEYSFNLAVEEIKKNTRRYAKRQLTWARRSEKISMFNANDPAAVLEFISTIW